MKVSDRNAQHTVYKTFRKIRGNKEKHNLPGALLVLNFAFTWQQNESSKVRYLLHKPIKHFVKVFHPKPMICRWLLFPLHKYHIANFSKSLLGCALMKTKHPYVFYWATFIGLRLRYRRTHDIISSVSAVLQYNSILICFLSSAFSFPRAG